MLRYSRLLFIVLVFSCLTTNAQVVGLSFRPVDAAFSLTLDRIILISANPNQLHIYNAATQTDQVVALAETPLNLSISPDGTHAAVAFTDAVAYIDLQAAIVIQTFANQAVGTGIVIFGSGYIYVAPNGSGGNTISINVASGQSTVSNSYYYMSGGVFNPVDLAVYSTEDDTSPNSLNRYDASGGVLGNSTSQPSDYFAVFDICGPLWLSHDSATIYSSCGTIYQASSDPAQDMRYVGILPGLGSNGIHAQSLATSDQLSQIAFIPSIPSFSTQTPPPTDTVVNLIDSVSFNQTGQFSTTPFVVNSASFAAHGRWVFYNAASTAMFIVTQADPTAGLELDYAVENVNLGNPNSCNATFGTAAASAIGPGGYATAPIVAGEDCVFTAVSNAPWITLSSGYYGSGNTTLTYLVRPNLTASFRSGTITMGAQTFNVNQTAAPAASPLTPLSFNPVAADYDKPLDKIVMVAAAPNELHIYDPVSQADQIVPLPYLPLSVSVRPDGLFAAVGHSGKISIVDLQGLAVTQTIPVDMDNGGISLPGNGYAYAFPSQTASWGIINSVLLSNGTKTALLDTYDGNIPRLYADGNYLYVGGGGSSKLNISNGPAVVTSSNAGMYADIWLSEDGVRLVNSGGALFFTSSIPSQDLQPDGQLSGANNVDWATNSQIQHQTAILTDPNSYGTVTSNTELQIYADNGLELLTQIVLPGFSNGGNSYFSHGKYILWNAAAQKLFAVIQADSSSGLLSSFAVDTIVTCTASLSASGQSFAASGGTGTISVSAPDSCSWSLAGAPAWLTFTSATSGTGNGTITYNVGPNTGMALSSQFTIGDLTFTAQQVTGLTSGLSFIGSMAQLASGDGWDTELTLLNTGSSPAEALLNLWDESGSGLILPFSFPQQLPVAHAPFLASALDQTIAPNALLLLDSQQPSGSVEQVGSAQLFSAGSVSGFATFRDLLTGQEAVVPLESVNAPAYVMPYDNTGGLSTGVALANVSSTPATIPVILRDDTGASLGSATIQLAGFGHTSFMLNTNYAETAVKRGTVEFDPPSGGQISVLGLRASPLVGRSSFSVTTLPALANVTPGIGSIAQVAAGSGWQTSFSLVNVGTAAANAQLAFFDNNGLPWSLPLTLPQSGTNVTESVFNATLQPGETLLVLASNGSPSVVGSALLTTTGNVGAFTLFHDNLTGQEAAVPLQTVNAGGYVLAFDNTNGMSTGVAVANVSSQTAAIPVTLRNDAGSWIGAATLTVPGNGHSSFMLTDATNGYPATVGIRGTVEFDTPAGGQISIVGLRATPILNANSFAITTVPPIIN